jgi:hypothetical protein
MRINRIYYLRTTYCKIIYNKRKERTKIRLIYYTLAVFRLYLIQSQLIYYYFNF